MIGQCADGFHGRGKAVRRIDDGKLQARFPGLYAGKVEEVIKKLTLIVRASLDLRQSFLDVSFTQTENLLKLIESLPSIS